MIDGIAGRSTSYEYDLAGRNVASTVTDTTEYDLVASGTIKDRGRYYVFWQR